MLKPQVIKISKGFLQRTSIEWSAALQRLSDCSNDAETEVVLSGIGSIKVKCDSLGEGTPGRSVLKRLCELSSSHSVLSSVALKVKDKIVVQYSQFLRCLGCDKEFLNYNAFFRHLNGHRKNLTGTKRKYPKKENEYLALLQLSLISDVSTLEDLVEDFVNEDLPQWVIGTRNNVLPQRDHCNLNVAKEPQNRETIPRQRSLQQVVRSNSLEGHELIHSNLEDTTNSRSSSVVKQEIIPPQSSLLGAPYLSCHPITEASEINQNQSGSSPVIKQEINPPQSSASSVHSSPNLDIMAASSIKPGSCESEKQVSPVQSDSIKLSPRPPTVASTKNRVDSGEEKCNQVNEKSKLNLYGRPSDIKHSRLQIENIRKDLSMKSSDKHTHFSTLVYLEKNHCGRGSDNEVSFPNEPPKSQTKNDSLDSSTGQCAENKESSNIKLYGTESDIQKFKTAFALLRKNLSLGTGYKYTNLDVIDYLCKNYNDSSPQEPQTLKANNNEANKTTLSPSFTNTDVLERKYFLATWNCIDHFGLSMNNHGKLCDGDIVTTSTSEKRIGFTCKEKIYECKKCKWKYRLVPTPRYKGRGISDYSAALALHTSGGHVNDISRYSKHLGFSLPNTNKFQKKNFKLDVLRKVVRNRAIKAKEKNIAKAVEKYGKGLLLNGDMAHGTRKNSKASTFTVMNPSTHEVLMVANVFRCEEPIAQKHEAAGATAVCEDIARRGLWVNGLCVDRGSKAKKPFKTAFGSPPLHLKRLATSKIRGNKRNTEVDDIGMRSQCLDTTTKNQTADPTAKAHNSKVVEMEMEDQASRESRATSNCSAGPEDASISFAFTSPPLEETDKQAAGFDIARNERDIQVSVNIDNSASQINVAISGEETRQQADLNVANPPDNVPTKAVTVENPKTCAPIVINDDLWHDTSKLEPFLKEELKIYHRFDDKIILLRKHFYVCINLCRISEHDYRDPEKLEAAKTKLRHLLLQSANHFQGSTNLGQDFHFHEDCHPSSKCRQKKNFCMSSQAISQWEADFLRSVIKKTRFYQHPENYLLGLNTSVVESFHNIQNIYRNKNTTYEDEEYGMRIDLATLHFDEVIKDKYENGEKAQATEYSNGPKHLPKKTITKRLFISEIDQDYFNEMFSFHNSEPSKKSRKKASSKIISPEVPSGLVVKKCTDKVMDIRKPDPNKQVLADLTEGSEILHERQSQTNQTGKLSFTNRNIVLKLRDVNSNPVTATGDVVSTRTSPTTISSNRTVTNVEETFVNELSTGPTYGGSVRHVAQISGENKGGSRKIIAKRATVLGSGPTVTMAGYANNGNIASQQAAIGKPQPVSIQRLHQQQPIFSQRLNQHEAVTMQSHHQYQPVLSHKLDQHHPAIKQRLDHHQPVIRQRLEESEAVSVINNKLHHHHRAINHRLDQHHPVISPGLDQHQPVFSQRLEQPEAVISQGLEQHHCTINQRVDKNHPAINQRLDQHHPVIYYRLDQHQPHISQRLDQVPTHQPHISQTLDQGPTRHQPVISQGLAHHQTVAIRRPPQHQPVKIQSTYQEQNVATVRFQPRTITILSPRHPIVGQHSD